MTIERDEKMNNLNPRIKDSKCTKRVKASRKPQAEHETEQWLRSIEHNLIRRRAREIFVERGSKPGQDLDNWLKAEAEVKRTLEEAEQTLNSDSVANGSGLNGNN